ncbi:MAG: CHASE2 domain-containing protein [Cyanobacteria bacterium SBLK]|nr:CHASE2 domain-containing protein [Cyanobacteria bacterium SBLK]
MDIIVLTFTGNLQENGFHVRAVIQDKYGKKQSTWGYLPALPDLAEQYNQWHSELQELANFKANFAINKRGIKTKNNNLSPRERMLQRSQQRKNKAEEKQNKYNKIEKTFVDKMNNWLEDDEFQPIIEKIEESILNTREIWIRVLTSDMEILKLPWNSWYLLKRKKKTRCTITFSPVNFEIHYREVNYKPRVFLIFGNLENPEIQKQEEKIWKNIPSIQIVRSLKNKSREYIYNELQNTNYEILYFSGHSRTQDKIGRFYINTTEYLEIPNLAHIISQKTNLKLVFFNSCDGLGLASQFYEHQLNIPNLIVMRNIVHNRISYQFLEQFINKFTQEKKALHIAFKEIRNFLEDNKDRESGAYLLPVLIQLSDEPQFWKDWFLPLPSHLEVSVILSASCLLSFLILFMRLLGLFQDIELKAFDHLMRMRPSESPDERITIVTIDESDIQYQEDENLKLSGSLSDRAFVKLLEKLNHYQAKIVGSDIYHRLEYTPDLNKALQQTQKFFAVCRIAYDAEEEISPSPSLTEKQVGFANFPLDPDGFIRRYWLGRSKGNECSTDRSFALRLALSYLEFKGITMRRKDELRIIGDVPFPKLVNNIGGYQLPSDEMGGYQILINYRSSAFNTISLREIISEQIDSEKLDNLLKNRIILLGVITKNNDDWLTPYSRGRPPSEMSGVFIHAHAISQILSAVLDERPLLTGLSQWVESFWIGFWGIIGSLFFIAWRSPLNRIVYFFLISISICVLYCSCLLFLIRGTWLPLAPSFIALTGSFIISIIIYRLIAKVKQYIRFINVP